MLSQTENAAVASLNSSAPIVNQQSGLVFNQSLDLNNDGRIQPVDPLILINHLAASAGSALPSSFDLNSDGVVSVDDAQFVVDYLNSISGSDVSVVAPNPAIDVQQSDGDSVIPEGDTMQVAVAAEPPNSSGGDGTPSPSDAPPEVQGDDGNLTNAGNNETIGTKEEIPWYCCKKPPHQESISQSYPISVVPPLDAAYKALKATLPNLGVKPFANVPDNFSIPLPLVPWVSSLNIPVPFASSLREWTLEEILDAFYSFQKTRIGLGDFTAIIVAFRDKDMDPGCGCNMYQPALAANSIPLSVSGNITVDARIEIVDSSFPDDHRYPNQNPDLSFNHPHNQAPARRGNLVDEVARYTYKLVGTLGIDLDLRIFGSGIHVNETIKIEPKIVGALEFVCSKGKPVAVVESLESKGEN